MTSADTSATTQPTRRTQAADLAGVIGIAVIVLGMILAAAAYEGSLGQAYSVANHFVSELGEIGVSRLALAFNAGLVLGGLGIAVFVAGFVSRLEGWFRWVVGPIGVVTGIFGSLVGVFPMNALAAHFIVANSFFYLGMVTMILFSVYVLVSRHRELPRWIAIPGMAAAAALFAFLFLAGSIEQLVNSQAPTPNLGVNRPDVWVSALFEWVAVAAVLLWVATVAVLLLVAGRIRKKTPDP